MILTLLTKQELSLKYKRTLKYNSRLLQSYLYLDKLLAKNKQRLVGQLPNVMALAMYHSTSEALAAIMQCHRTWQLAH